MLLVGAAARDLFLVQLTTSGFDLKEAGAWLLGTDARAVLAHGSEPQQSQQALDAILKPEIDPDGALRLVGQMPPGDRDRQLALLGLPRRPRREGGSELAHDPGPWAVEWGTGEGESSRSREPVGSTKGRTIQRAGVGAAGPGLDQVGTKAVPRTHSLSADFVS